MKVATSAKNALDSKKAVVALESSVISQGLAYPKNLEIAHAMEDCIRKEHVHPSTLAIIDGVITVGCTVEEIKRLATESGILKAGSREIGIAVAKKKNSSSNCFRQFENCCQSWNPCFCNRGYRGCSSLCK